MLHQELHRPLRGRAPGTDGPDRVAEEAHGPRAGQQLAQAAAALKSGTCAMPSPASTASRSSSELFARSGPCTATLNRPASFMPRALCSNHV
jgi:hypothetical protein